MIRVFTIFHHKMQERNQIKSLRRRSKGVKRERRKAGQSIHHGAIHYPKRRRKAAT
jgi:hypothetical protein